MTLPDPVEEFNIEILPQLMRQAREAAIEECARVAETVDKHLFAGVIPRTVIVAAIRALKDKP